LSDPLSLSFLHLLPEVVFELAYKSAALFADALAVAGARKSVAHFLLPWLAAYGVEAAAAWSTGLAFLVLPGK